ncbi:hypothetical protein Tco_1073974 [Tanacetum coccineum]
MRIIFLDHTIAIAKKIKAIIQKDELTIADLEGAGLERLKHQYQNDVELEYHVDQLKAAVLTKSKWKSDEDEVSKPRSFERHMSKNTKPHPSFYNNDFKYLVCLSTKEKYTTSITKHYAVSYYKQDSRIDFFKSEMSTRTEGRVYLDSRIKSVVCIIVKKKWGYGFLSSIVAKRSDDKEYEFSYADLPRLSLNDVEDMIPFTMTTTHKGVVYLNQHNVKSLIKLSKVKKLCDGTLEKIWENTIDMVKRNKLGTDNKRLKGRDWTDMDVEKSNEIVDKIDKTLKHRKQLKRLEEYIGGRPKTVNPCTFVRPM